MTQIQINSFQTMYASFGDSHDLESPGTITYTALPHLHV